MIFHWCPAPRWEASQSIYTAPSLGEDGFIHCSYREQIEVTATAIDRGRDDLVLLCIEGEGLPVVVEDCYGSDVPYPHVYGPIPLDSVAAVVRFPPSADGSFRLPPHLPR